MCVRVGKGLAKNFSDVSKMHWNGVSPPFQSSKGQHFCGIVVPHSFT